MTKCALCEKNAMFDSVAVPLYERLESGKIADLWSNKSQSVSAGVPLCNFHLLFVEKGLIYFVHNELYFVGQLTLKNSEGKSDKEIREEIKEYKDNPDYSIAVASMRCLLKARKFEKDMAKNGTQ